MNSSDHPIVISSLDLKRLEDLLELPAYRDAKGADALRDELSRASILEPGEMPGDVVTMNSTASVKDETSGQTRELSLVYPREVDGGTNRVSILAPVGSAMLGLRVGQSIDWKIPGGRALRLRITNISYQPEASGQLHR